MLRERLLGMGRGLWIWRGSWRRGRRGGGLGERNRGVGCGEGRLEEWRFRWGCRRVSRGGRGSGRVGKEGVRVLGGIDRIGGCGEHEGDESAESEVRLK